MTIIYYNNYYYLLNTTKVVCVCVLQVDGCPMCRANIRELLGLDGPF